MRNSSHLVTLVSSALFVALFALAPLGGCGGDEASPKATPNSIEDGGGGSLDGAGGGLDAGRTGSSPDAAGDGAQPTAPDTVPPVISGGLPIGALPGGTTQATLRVTTNESATCRYSTTAGVAYGAMTNTFSTTGTTSHSTALTGLHDGTSYTFYVRCQDASGNATTSDYVVSFSVGTGAGPLAVSLSPSRTSGVAPLYVFFDASGTTDTAATSRPFHDLDYRWDFGDPNGPPTGSTTWSTGSGPLTNSRNSAIGPMAGHVFEVPGTYTVSLSVFDGTHSSGATTTITVADPQTVFAGTNTFCFSTSGNFTDCPAGANHVTTSNFDSAVTTNAAQNRRLLFRRGESFTGASSAVIQSDGPGIVGAYGPGAKPKVTGPGSASVISLGTRGGALRKDWRFIDLSLDGQNNQAGENVGIDAKGQFDQVTILRVDVAGTSTGFAASHWALQSGEKSFDQWAIHDSTATGVPNCNWDGHYVCNWRIYVVGTRWSMQGNALDNLGQTTAPYYAGGSHVIRTEMLQTSVISNNTLRGAGNFQLDIKLHAWAWDGSAGGNATAQTYTEKILISDNKIQGGANTWMLSLGPQDEVTDERVRDVLVERNWFTSNARTQLQMHINSSTTTIRNNLCDLTGAAYHTGVSVDQWGVTPAPVNVRVYNNTVYSGSSGDFVAVQIGTASSTIVQNNLASAPSATGPVLIDGSGAGLTQSNNLLNNTPANLFVSGAPSAPTTFSLKALPNPARDTGLTAAPVLSDFFGTHRPQGSAPDLGAVEGP
jgi:hypothetical protein